MSNETLLNEIRASIAAALKDVEVAQDAPRFAPAPTRDVVMTLDDGRTAMRRHMFVEIPVDPRAAYCATRDLLRRVTSQGPGTVWFMLAPVHIIEDDGVVVHPGSGGFDVMRLRTIYYHEAHAFSLGATAGTYENAITSDVVTSSALRTP